MPTPSALSGVLVEIEREYDATVTCLKALPL
jgi:hypothetical protein